MPYRGASGRGRFTCSGSLSLTVLTTGNSLKAKSSDGDPYPLHSEASEVCKQHAQRQQTETGRSLCGLLLATTCPPHFLTYEIGYESAALHKCMRSMPVKHAFDRLSKHMMRDGQDMREHGG